tara:strand:- start:9700 stop:10986 length:1287 start_codon:yes stop_codon:yes gene_type:complete
MYEDKEIERILLGKIISFPDQYIKHHDNITENMFVDPTNINVFNSYSKLQSQGKSPDLINLSKDLTGTEDHINLTLSRMANQDAFLPIEVETCIIRLKEAQTNRNIFEFAKQLGIYIENREDVSKIIDFISKKSGSLDSNSIFKEKEISDQLSDVLKELEKRINSDGLTGVPTGFESLDKFTGGWQETDLVIVGGASSMGKTSLALAFALNASKQSVPTAIFSYEMSYQQLLMRMISSETGIDNKWMLNGTLDMKNFETINKQIGKIEKLPLYIDDCNRTSLTYLLNRIRKLHSTKGIKLVLVDYLQLVNASSKKNNREQEVSLIARSLKNISKELGITIIALSQLNRGVGLRTESRPTMADLRESGEIEQAADIVVLVYRPEYYGITDVEGENTRGLAEIIFAKGRNIGVGKINMKFIPNLTKFVDN